MATLRRLHPAPPAIKASAVVRRRILFAIGFIFPFYSVLPDTLLGAVRCVSTGTPVTAHRSAPRYRAEIFYALFLFALCCHRRASGLLSGNRRTWRSRTRRSKHGLASVSNTDKGNRRAGTKRVRLAANSLKYEEY